MVSRDRVEEAAMDYLQTIISNNPATVVLKLILLGDSGGFSRDELKEISSGGSQLNSGSRNAARKSSSSRIIGVQKKLGKKTRKVSKYQKAFGKHLKALKKKHPRTNVSSLMKKAHRLTKKELK